MARILVTGAGTGIGRGAAQELLAHGHTVLVHARSADRLGLSSFDSPLALPVIADLTSLEETRGIAEQVAQHGGVDAVIHNAGVLDGAAILPVNVVAPFVVSALVPARRHIFLSSGMHRGGHASLEDLDWSGETETASYSDSKLLVTVLAAAIGRVRPDVFSNAVDPGWVPTRMGGQGAPDDLELGHRTQAWLAEGEDPATDTSAYWHHQRQQTPHPAVHDEQVQDRVVRVLAEYTSVPPLS